MHQLSKIIITIVLVQLHFSCVDKNAQNKTGKQPHTIQIKGSDTEFAMVQELATAYMSEHPEVIIQVEGGGSMAGMKALAAGELDILNSSREISNIEKHALSEHKIHPLPILFSIDAVAIITNYRVAVDSLSTDEVRRLFNGEIRNWSELGGDNIPVTLVGRDQSSGTRDYFMRKILRSNSFGTIRAFASNHEILEEVIKKPGAIGYVGAGFLFDENGKPNGKIWAMPIYLDQHNAVSPYQKEAVKHGDYVLTRPLLQYVDSLPNELIQDFILFELSKRGQDIVIKHGFFPIVDPQTQINRII